MSRKNTSAGRSRSVNRNLLYLAGGAIALAGLGSGLYFMLRPSRKSGVSSLDTLPPNPPEDRFGNRGDENMVEPLTLREDQILMRDRMNPYDSLY